VTPAAGVPGTVFLFDATLCSDPDFGLEDLLVRWDWNSDGVYETAWNLQKVISRSYNEFGMNFITVEVSNSLDVITSCTKIITIHPPDQSIEDIGE